ncbi:hypothetical protein [Brevibacillus porteri]
MEQNWEAFGYGISTLGYIIEKIISYTPAPLLVAVGLAVVLGAVYSRLAR